MTFAESINQAIFLAKYIIDSQFATVVGIVKRNHVHTLESYDTSSDIRYLSDFARIWQLRYSYWILHCHQATSIFFLDLHNNLSMFLSILFFNGIFLFCSSHLEWCSTSWFVGHCLLMQQHCLRWGTASYLADFESHFSCQQVS